MADKVFNQAINVHGQASWDNIPAPNSVILDQFGNAARIIGRGPDPNSFGQVQVVQTSSDSSQVRYPLIVDEFGA